MKKRINSTGRKSLGSESIDIRLSKLEGEIHPTFSAKLDLTSMLELDGKAKIYVEPYTRTSSMRFDFGTVSAPQLPENTVLSELDENVSVLFRVKVVDESSTVGKILAVANVRPTNLEDDGDNKKSILKLRTTDIGDMIWLLDCDPYAGPELLITNRVPGLSNRLKTDPLLQGAIFPFAFREIVRTLLSDETNLDSEWAVTWRGFVKELTGEDPAEVDQEEDENDQLAETAMRKFCEIHGFASKAAAIEEVTQ